MEIDVRALLEDRVRDAEERLSNTVNAQIDDILGKKMAEFTTPEPEEKEITETKLGAPPLAGIAKAEPFGLPIGQVLIGGAAAVAVGELVDMVVGRFMPQGGTWMSALGKAVAAWLASSKWVTNVIGKDAGTAATILLTYDAVRTVIPFDTWIASRIPGHSMGEFGSRAMTEASQVANDYYAKALGG